MTRSKTDGRQNEQVEDGRKRGDDWLLSSCPSPSLLVEEGHVHGGKKRGRRASEAAATPHIWATQLFLWGLVQVGGQRSEVGGHPAVLSAGFDPNQQRRSNEPMTEGRGAALHHLSCFSLTETLRRRPGGPAGPADVHQNHQEPGPASNSGATKTNKQ